MNYREAFEKFNTDNTVCIVVRTKDGIRALAEHNFNGGVCGCCQGCDSSDNLTVEKVVDLETMTVLYSAADI